MFSRVIGSKETGFMGSWQTYFTRFALDTWENCGWMDTQRNTVYYHS